MTSVSASTSIFGVNISNSINSIIGLGLEGQVVKFINFANFFSHTYYTYLKSGHSYPEFLNLDKSRPEIVGRGFSFNWPDKLIQMENLSQMFKACSFPDLLIVA